MHGLGKCYYEHKQTDIAIKYFRKVLAINPNNSSANYSLANCLYLEDKTDEAI